MTSTPVFKGFSLNISFKRADNRERVCYKRDRNRFEGFPNTVKFEVDRTYTVVMTVRPSRGLRNVWINGEKMALEHVQPGLLDDDVSIYSMKWTTADMEKTKRSTRYLLPVEIEDGVSAHWEANHIAPHQPGPSKEGDS